MKLSEFEERLATVSDRKLRLMLEDCRAKGPEVAVKLILAEAGRRGLDLDAPLAPAGAEASGTAAAPASRPLTGLALEDEAPGEAAPDAVPGGEDAPKGAWLAEEQSSGMPMFIKVLIVVVILGGALAALLMILNRGG